LDIYLNTKDGNLVDLIAKQLPSYKKVNRVKNPDDGIFEEFK
jgi:hypothetical protein